MAKKRQVIPLGKKRKLTPERAIELLDTAKEGFPANDTEKYYLAMELGIEALKVQLAKSQEVCPECHGEGKHAYAGTTVDIYVGTCITCQGTGKVLSDTRTASRSSPQFHSVGAICPTCQGKKHYIAPFGKVPDGTGKRLDIALDNVERMGHFGVVRDWTINLKDGMEVLLNARVIQEIIKHENAEQRLDRPKIICLCGSTRFVAIFNEWRQKLTLEGKIVVSIELVLPQSEREDPQHSNYKVKQALDELHLRKIDLADEVMILNVGGYIGESTRNELNYAMQIGKTITYLEEQDG
ncbi:hypothetical protein LCGC14_0350140 [marine sediment metagenome]|uniref:Uncharacterized protein n=1 Tax=marine sediment metagenome TaxID=412755 RepID=A0A0F9TU45_9ZZZZ